MQNTIYQRVYKFKRRFTAQGKPIVEKVPVGMILARKPANTTETNVVEFGYSSVHPSDKYSDKEAFQHIYPTRQVIERKELPTNVRDVFPRFVERARKYFKDSIVKM